MRRLTRKVSQLLLVLMLVLNLVFAPVTYAEVKTIHLDQDNSTVSIAAECGGGNLKVTISGGSEPTTQIAFDVRQKNIFDGVFNSGFYNSGGVVESSSYMRSKNFIPVMPSTEYITSEVKTDDQVLFYDKDMNYISETGSVRPFTTPSNCKYIKFYFYGSNLNIDFQIEKGAVATEFEPFSGKVLYLDEELTDTDTAILNENGTVSIEKNVKHVVLDGSVGVAHYKLSSPAEKTVDYKRLRTINVFANSILEDSANEKFHTLITPTGEDTLGYRMVGRWNDANISIIYSENGRLEFSVANSFSGWGQDYDPTLEEISAMLNGWVMMGDSGVLYSVGDKHWIKRYQGIGTSSRLSGVDILVEAGTSRDQCPKEKAYGDNTKGYELWYDLAEPENYDKHLGILSFNKGINHATILGEGDYTTTVEYRDRVDDIIEQLAKQSNEQTAIMKELLSLMKSSGTDERISFQYDDNGNLKILKKTLEQ